jgi:ribonucleoside-diphosphate reductase alpha chain
MTGIASNSVLSLDMKQAAKAVKKENKRVAELIGINPAARCTAVKPAGTTSLVLGTSSGIHAWHNDYYVRRLRVGKNESIYRHLLLNHPELVEDEYFSPHDTAVISVPQKAPPGATLRTESALQLLKRVKKVTDEWVFEGYRKGPNNHNVSATISIRESEWQDIGEWMWENRDSYTGLSVLPYDGGTYKQAPFEDCSKETYEVLFEALKKVDLSSIREETDNTDLSAEAACAGGSCEIKFL